MGLISCYDCAEEISDKARVCPMCGAPRTDRWTVYTSLKGRISRSTFWIRLVLPSTLLLVVIAVLAGEAYPVPVVLALLVTFWVYTVGFVKRLQDRDMTGKHVAAAWIILFATTSFMASWGQDEAFRETLYPSRYVLAIAVFAGLVYALRVLIVIAFLRGSQGPNRFGRPDPMR